MRKRLTDKQGKAICSLIANTYKASSTYLWLCFIPGSIVMTFPLIARLMI